MLYRGGSQRLTELHEQKVQPRCLCRFYADQCCGAVTDTLGRMSLIMQQVPDRAASDAWFSTLGDSYQLGQAPAFNLARCLAANKDILSVQAA